MGTESIGKITVPCKCGAKLKAPASAVGRKAKCPKCGEVLLVQAPTEQDQFGDALYELASDARAAAENGLEDETSPAVVGCPSCQQPMSAGAVLCTSCGFDRRTGRTISPAGAAAPPSTLAGGTFPPMPPKMSAPAARAVAGGSLLMGTVFSAIAAFIGALVWFGIAKATEYEIGWIAWGVGIAAGFGMALGYKGRNAASGGIAAAMAIGGIVLGKYIVFTTVVVPLIDQTFTQMFDGLSDDDVLQVHMTQEQLRQDGIDPMSATDEQTETASDQAERTVARMDASTKQTRTAEAKIAVRSLGSKAVMEDKVGFFFSSMFSPIDLLFIVIAVASAFKVATAGGEAESS